MNAEQALEWMKLFNEKIQEQKDCLSELDTPIGDGDHGGNMARGMAAVMENLEGKQFETSSDVFKVVSMQLLSKVGGASGPLYGSAFMGMAKADSNSKIDEILQSGLDMIVKRGKAEVGEKTMVDVWTPVIAALSAGQLTQEVIDKVVNATKDLLATKGRATYVGGTEDGGIGTSFDQVDRVVSENPADTLLAFFDLGSAKMNLEMVADFSDKSIMINRVPIVEGAYTAAALLQAGAELSVIQTQLSELEINK